jgi:hypothetical protein
VDICYIIRHLKDRKQPKKTKDFVELLEGGEPRYQASIIIRKGNLPQRILMNPKTPKTPGNLAPIAEDETLLNSLLEQYQNRSNTMSVTLTTPNKTTIEFVIKGASSYEGMITLRNRAVAFAEVAKSKMPGELEKYTPIDFEAAVKLFALHDAIVKPKMSLEYFIKLSHAAPTIPAAIEQIIDMLTETDITFNTVQEVEQLKNS